MAITRITKGVIEPNENYDTHNIVSTGIITSVGADINGDLDVDGHTNLDNVSISGVTTFSGSVNNLVLSELDVNGNADISGNLSVGGVLTYEDVTSIDSVGIITARNDIHVGAGVSVVGVVTATTFVGALTGTASGNPTLANGANNRIITALGANELYGEPNLTWTGSYFETSAGAESWTMRARSGGPRSFIGFQNQYLANGYTIGCGADNQSFVVYTNRQNGGERLRIDHTGISTFYQNLFASKDFDVDGHTNLDNVSVAGVSTFASKVSVGGSITATGLIQATGGSSNGIKLGSSLHLTDAANTQITQQNNASIYLNADNIELRNRAAGSYRQYIRCGSWASGAVGLFHDDGSNANERLRTTSSGITVTGNVSATGSLSGDSLFLQDNKKILVGTGSDLQIYHSGSNAFMLNSTGQFIIRGDDLQLRSQSNSSEFYLRAQNNAAVELYYNNSKKIETTNTGVTVTGTLTADQVLVGDQEKIRIGNSGDLLLMHDANGSEYGTSGSSYIKCQGVHDNILNIFTATATGKIHLKSNNLSETMLSAIGNGAVELYYDGSKRFETTNVGAKVTHSGAATRLVVGSTDASGAWLVLDGDSNGDGAGSDYAYIEHNSSGHLNLINPVGGIALKGGGVNSVVCQEDAEVVLYHNGNRKFETQTTGAKVTGILDVTGNITGSGDLTLTDTTADSAAGPELKLYRNSASPADADYLGQIKFAGESDTSVERNYAKITGKILDASNGTEDGIIEFAHIKAGSQTITGRWRSDSLQLLNGTALTVAGSTTVTGNIIPSSDSATDIGTNGVRFANIYADTLYGDGSNLTGLTAGVISDSQYNTVAGTDAGRDLTSNSHSNNYFGHVAGEKNDTGDNNCGFGRYSAYSIRGGSKNTMLGNESGVACQSGDGNVCVGFQAGYDVTGSNNTLIGHMAAGKSTSSSTDLTSGSNNIFIGYDVKSSTTTISNEIALGNENINHFRIPGIGVSFSEGGGVTTGIMTASAFKLLDGSAVGGVESDAQYNTVAGTNAGDSFSGTSAEKNTLFGYEAGTAITSADGNTAVGYQALKTATTGGYSTAVGRGALQKNNGTDNTAIGFFASNENTSGTNNNSFGQQSGRNTTTGSWNCSFGNLSLNTNTTGNYNTCFGVFSLRNSTSSSNSVFGYSAGASITSGSNNTAVGFEALSNVTSAAGNTVVGYRAFKYNTGTRNTGLGFMCGAGSNGSSGTDNTIIGYFSAYQLTSGSENVAIGQEVGEDLTTGTGNVLLGVQAAKNIVSGGNNVIIGRRASNTNTNDITSGSNNIILGYLAQATSSTVSNEITLGNTSITKFRIPGINVTLKDNGGTPTQGHVLTVDGNGEAGFAAASGTTINNNANNRIITGSGTANTLEGEATLTYDGTSVFELQPASATPAQFVGDSNRTGAGQGIAHFQGNWNGTTVARMTIDTGSDTSNKDDGMLRFWTAPSGSQLERLRITPDGQITTRGASGTGFNNAGNNDFGSFLTVNGGHTANQWGILSLEGNTSASGYAVGAIQFINQNNANSSSGANTQSRLLAKIDVQSVTSDSNAGDDSGGTFTIYTKPEAGNPLQRLNINETGAVKIGNGTGTGGGGLAIYGGTVNQSSGQDANLYIDARSAADWGIWLNKPGHEYGFRLDTTTGATLAFAIYGSGSLKHQFKGNGDYIAQGTVDSASDIKLKTNIKTIDNALDKVLQLRGAEYDRIDRDNQHEIGVIAQEVEEVIPELVHGDETKTVSYGNMVAVLIEAIKEQNEVINKMKKEIEDLKG